MFCPVGYVSFSDALSNIDDLCFYAYLKMTGQREEGQVFRLSQDDEMIRSGLVKNRGNGQFARELMMEILLARLLELSPPLACSPNGTVMQLSEPFFLHADRLDWIHIRWPLDEMSEFSSYFDYHKAGKFSGISVRQRYCFIDAELGLITIKHNSRRLFDSAWHSSEQWGSQMISLAENFKGWSLCWNESDLPTSHDLVSQAFPVEAGQSFWMAAFSEQTDPMGNSSDRILSMLLEAYPEGKKDKWDIVERRVGYSRRAIERALADTNRKDWKGQQGGQE